MVSSTPDARARDGRSHTFELHLCLKGSPFPGNGISRPETTRPKSPPRRNSSLQRPLHRRQSPPLRGVLAQSGKFLSSKECVVADAVDIEPLSASNFPASREKYREFCRF